MFLYELISARRNNPFFINFMLGICLALSFEPFNIPFLSIPVIGFLFLINDHVFYSNHRRVKIFFLNGIFFGFGFFLFSMYWISNSVLVLDERLNYLVPIILFFFLYLCLCFLVLCKLLTHLYGVLLTQDYSSFQ